MPETEQIILSNFLLPPAPLPSIISLEKFTDLFPTSQRSNPQVEHLYRELQGLRSLYIEDVKRNISREVKRGERQRHQVVKTRRQGAYVESEPAEGRAKGAQIEPLEQTPKLPIRRRQHTLSSILPEMEQACTDIDAEIVASEAEFEMMKEDMESTVGGLSDLRYGRFSKPIGSDGELREEVLDGLKRLDETCISRRGSSWERLVLPFKRRHAEHLHV